MHHLSVEFQAIILAGYGENLSTLSMDTPKALLPIANKPMIEYVLQWLENAGIQEIIVVGQAEHEKELGHYLSKVYESPYSNSRIDFVVSDDYGTVEAIRAAKDKIRTDCIIVGCDLITDVSLEFLLEKYRLNNPSVLCLLGDLPKMEQFNPGGGACGKEGKQHVALDNHNHSVVYLNSEEEVGNEIAISSRIFRRFGSINYYPQLKDKHVFIMKHWVVNWMLSREGKNSLKEDIIPMIVKSQFSASRVKKYHMDKYMPVPRSLYAPFQYGKSVTTSALIAAVLPEYAAINKTAPRGPTPTASSGQKSPGLLKLMLNPEMVKQKSVSDSSIADSVSDNSNLAPLKDSVLHDKSVSLQNTGKNKQKDGDIPISFIASVFVSPVSSLAAIPDSGKLDENKKPAYASNSLIKKELDKLGGTYCVRANSMASFIEMNRLMARLSTTKIPASVETHNAQIGNDCLIGEGCVIGVEGSKNNEKTSIKRCVIASHCFIGKGVKLANCVILDHARIEDYVRLEGCVVSSYAVIKEKCSLKECEVGRKYEVPPGLNGKSERFYEARIMSADESEA
ncbi:hypothetical protein MP638_007560 [Amoeboaphelidium occidentale]|nr:hypothetical protein MP638_007560 [Amoeboaphelidium occidentale]